MFGYRDILTTTQHFPYKIIHMWFSSYTINLKHILIVLRKKKSIEEEVTNRQWLCEMKGKSSNNCK